MYIELLMEHHPSNPQDDEDKADEEQKKDGNVVIENQNGNK